MCERAHKLRDCNTYPIKASEYYSIETARKINKLERESALLAHCFSYCACIAPTYIMVI